MQREVVVELPEGLISGGYLLTVTSNGYSKQRGGVRGALDPETANIQNASEDPARRVRHE
jgi:hypothetical protein